MRTDLFNFGGPFFMVTHFYVKLYKIIGSSIRRISMYAYLHGELKGVYDDYIVVEISGIGYEVYCPNPDRFIKYLDDLVKVYTYHHVREVAKILYGFIEEEEKELFKMLLNVSGIGPTSELNIVGHITVSELAVAIEQEDEAYLTKFPGVCKKTARQMILDLKGKMGSWLHIESKGNDIDKHKDDTIFVEGFEALKALGYTSREINHISKQLKTENIKTVDDVVR